VARCQPQGRGVLRPRPRRAPPVDSDPRGIRLHAPGGDARGGRRGASPVGEGEHRGGVHRGQGLGAARQSRPSHDAQGSVGDGLRLGPLPARARASGLLRRRALLRRIPGEPRVHRPRPSRGARGRRRDPGAVRHERRKPAPRGGAGRGVGRRGSTARSGCTSTTTRVVRSQTRSQRSEPGPRMCRVV